ncbi:MULTISPECIES: radical SAM protein [Bifidobacterium]|uniref:radical SAM protein n=1 Tax=Bifidobacterium TaxID=1678 RepID=UPI002649972E|nr:radical SAM protein [Bifidobacterium crudilactis]MDN5973495.1 radical SAM protein [Bifidobacterium crudilactis]MDN6001814.1 radical SAM protein [Bifidobacterium crudilactis]MDN6553831.1 radical SAM protein [Bifidobacterium mongoliense]
MVALGITIDRKCNIRCSHCCFSSGPRASEHLTDEQVMHIVEQACDSPTIDTIGISGGEALIRYRLVMNCLRTAKAHRKPASLVSNGFWGQNIKRADLVLHQLKESGLRSLTLSFDEFHQDKLKVERIKNILDADTGVGIPISINVAVSKSHNSNQLLDQLGDSLMGIKVTKFPIQRVGAALQFPEQEIIRRHSVDDDLKCPGFEPTYHFDGKVYPCCSPVVFGSALVLGRVNDISVQGAVTLIQRNLLFSAMRDKGFKWLFQLCVKNDLLDESFLHRKYVDACEMCGIIFSNPEVVNGLIPLIKQEYKSEDQR